jgi:hypothetical protein
MVKNESVVLGQIKSSCSSGTCDIGMAIAFPQ